MRASLMPGMPILLFLFLAQVRPRYFTIPFLRLQSPAHNNNSITGPCIFRVSRESCPKADTISPFMLLISCFDSGWSSFPLQFSGLKRERRRKKSGIIRGADKKRAISPRLEDEKSRGLIPRGCTLNLKYSFI